MSDWRPMLGEHEVPAYRKEREFVEAVLASADEPSCAKAIQLLGHLARLDSAAAEFLEQQLLRAIEWLQPTHEGGQRQRIACLVVAELAENAPTLTYLHIRQACALASE